MILTHLVFFQFLGGASAGSAPPPGPPSTVIYRSDGDEKRRRKRIQELDLAAISEFREEREKLHSDILEAYADITGELRLPEPKEVDALEKKAGQLPKAERPAFRRTILQIKNWQAEIEQIDRILLRLDEQDLEDLSMLL